MNNLSPYKIIRWFLCFLCLGVLVNKVAAQTLGMQSYTSNFGLVGGMSYNVYQAPNESATAYWGGSAFNPISGVTGVASSSVGTITNTTADSGSYLSAIHEHVGDYSGGGTPDGVTSLFAEDFNFDCLVLGWGSASSMQTASLGDLSFDIQILVNGVLVDSASTVGNAGTTLSSAVGGNMFSWSLDSTLAVSGVTDNDILEVQYYAYSPSGTALNNESDRMRIGLADCSSGTIESGQVCNTVLVPEPSSALLLSLSSLLLLRRKR